jgi:UDP-N-acetylmuramoylalanine--D-glutamate ligase
MVRVGVNISVDMATEPRDALTHAVKEFSGRRAVVAGLGLSGVAASRLLRKCGAAVIATDLKPKSEIPGARALEALGVKIETGVQTGACLDNADLVVVSPGVPRESAMLERARAAGIEVISEIELAYRFMDAPVIAVAGTNGKSTVTALLGRVLEAAGFQVFVGGNIGTPAVQYAESVMEGGPEADYCVLEVSSFHLESTSTFRPAVGVLLNVTEDHLDRYRDFGDYARTKFRLFENQGPSDYAVVNASDPVISERVSRGLTRGEIVTFTTTGTLSSGLYLRGNDIVCVLAGAPEEVYPTKGFKLKGAHNIENIMAVIGAARLVKISPEVILNACSEFGGLPHRMEFVRELESVSYFDDSKGTNIGALAMALRSVGGPVVLIAGGVDKGGDYSALREAVKEKVKLMVLIGAARFRIKDALGTTAETVLVSSMEEAVSKASASAEPGDTVLLSPACSSFDMFSSYKERGELFKVLVRAL